MDDVADDSTPGRRNQEADNEGVSDLCRAFVDPEIVALYRDKLSGCNDMAAIASVVDAYLKDATVVMLFAPVIFFNQRCFAWGRI